MADEFKGFDDFSNLLEKYLDKTDVASVTKVLEVGAEEFVRDVRMLPKPRSQRGGRTHLLDTVTHRKKGNEVEVGWGKYYGTFLERGTRKMTARPHMKPTFERNKEKYYEKMQKALFD